MHLAEAKMQCIKTCLNKQFIRLALIGADNTAPTRKLFRRTNTSIESFFMFKLKIRRSCNGKETKRNSNEINSTFNLIGNFFEINAWRSI